MKLDINDGYDALVILSVFWYVERDVIIYLQ